MSEQLSIADALDRAADWLEPGHRWRRGVFQSFKKGELSCACAMGALAYTGAAGWLAISFVEDGLPAAMGGSLSPLAAWNDAPRRTKRQVINKLREEAKRARAEGK